MKNFLAIFLLIILFISCKDNAISKPDRLIEEDKMVAIFYDLAIIEGMKSQKPSDFQSFRSNDFIYKKFKIDSLQFAKSTKYYSSDITNYKKMLNEVSQKIESQKKNIDSIISKNPKKGVLPKIVKKEEQFVR